MLAHSKSPGRQNRRRPKHAKGASERARTRFGGQKSTFSLHERQPAERAALPLRKARRARKPHVGARPSFSPSAGCHPQGALRSPRPPLFAFRFAPRRRAAESGGCETGGPSTAAPCAGHSRCRAPPTARVAVRTRFRHRRCAFTAPHPQGIKPRPSVGKHGSDQLRSAPRHSSRVSRPHSTHRDPARNRRSTRPKRVRAAGLALAVKATPAAAPSARRPARTRLAVPRPPAAPSKAPSISAVPHPQRRK